MIYCIEYAKPISQIEESLNDCPMIFPLIYWQRFLKFQSFAARPFVFVSAKYIRATKPSDAVYVWLENVSSRSFEVCIKEFLPFDGKHQDTVVVGISVSFLIVP